MVVKAFPPEAIRYWQGSRVRRRLPLHLAGPKEATTRPAPRNGLIATNAAMQSPPPHRAGGAPFPLGLFELEVSQQPPSNDVFAAQSH